MVRTMAALLEYGATYKCGCNLLAIGMVYFSATNIPGKMLAVQEVYDHGKTAAPH